MSFKNPTFAERQQSAAAAKQKALEKLKDRPQVDEAVLAERRAAAEAREIAAAEKRAALIAERERAKAEKIEKARIAAEEAAAAAAAAEAAKPKPLTDEEKKAIRDARYAARKQRKK